MEIYWTVTVYWAAAANVIDSDGVLDNNHENVPDKNCENVLDSDCESVPHNNSVLDRHGENRLDSDCMMDSDSENEL